MKCPHCNKDIYEKRGLQNWRNLFKKPDVDSWITLILIALVLYLAWAYYRDLSICRGLLQDCVPRQIPFIPFANLTG